MTTDYLSLEKHPSKALSAPSNWWLAAGVAFSVGAAIQISRGAYSVANIMFSIVWCGGFFGWWWLGRRRWRGYLPVMVWDIGVGTDEVLDTLQKRRVVFSAGRLARHNPEAAVQYVIDLANEGLIDHDFVVDLLRPEPGEDYRPGTYL